MDSESKKEVFDLAHAIVGEVVRCFLELGKNPSAYAWYQAVRAAFSDAEGKIRERHNMTLVPVNQPGFYTLGVIFSHALEERPGIQCTLSLASNFAWRLVLHPVGEGVVSHRTVTGNRDDYTSEDVQVV